MGYLSAWRCLPKWLTFSGFSPLPIDFKHLNRITAGPNVLRLPSTFFHRTFGMCYAKDLHRKQITVAKTIFLLNLNEAEPERWEPSYFADTLRHCLVVKKISSFPFPSEMPDARRHCDKCLAATKCDKKCASLGSFHVLHIFHPGFEYFALPFARPCLAFYMEKIVSQDKGRSGRIRKYEKTAYEENIKFKQYLEPKALAAKISEY